MLFEQMRLQVEQFWNTTYAAYSSAERKAYWLNHLKKGVDWERSQGNDPYTVFEPEAYHSWCEQEPALVGWLPELCGALDLEVQEVERRIAGGQLGGS